MLGHIHKSQQWERGGRVVAYAGSPGRFHYGEEGDKGYLAWDVEAGSARALLVPTPARETVCVDFDGPPDMERLAAVAADAGDKFVRVRWQIDEEHRQSVDREAIEALFVGASALKLEPRILPVTRSRSQGISIEPSVDRKIERWAEHANVDAAPIVERFRLLESGYPEAIAAAVLADLTDGEAGGALAEPMPEPAVSSVEPLTAVLAERESDTVPDATVEVLPVAQKSWLEDDLFAA
jgi:exonuclease SbcD